MNGHAYLPPGLTKVSAQLAHLESTHGEVAQVWTTKRNAKTCVISRRPIHIKVNERFQHLLSAHNVVSFHPVFFEPRIFGHAVTTQVGKFPFCSLWTVLLTFTFKSE